MEKGGGNISLGSRAYIQVHVHSGYVSNAGDGESVKYKAQLTEKGSACSQLMEEPQEAFLEASGKDSGTMNIMNIRLNAVIIVAKTMTWTCPLA